MAAFRQEKEADRNAYFRDNLFPEREFILSATPAARDVGSFGMGCVTAAQSGFPSGLPSGPQSAAPSGAPRDGGLSGGITARNGANWSLLWLCKRVMLLDNVKKVVAVPG
jgi:hypothetical protein